MTAEFDSYRELLQIESPDRPPDHYALLGLERFESDRQKIDHAAGERMSVLQEFANSEHLDASQKLLNEVSAARRCLLDSTKKIAYDEELRARQKRSATRSKGKHGSKGKKGTPLLPVGVSVIVSLVLLTVFLLSRSEPKEAGNLIVEWPVDQRQGATISVDGNPLKIADENPLELKISAGRHRLMFQRMGYENIVKTVNFSDAKVILKLQWKKKK